MALGRANRCGGVRELAAAGLDALAVDAGRALVDAVVGPAVGGVRA